MKILIVNQHVNDVIGGSEAQCGLIAKGLTKLGHSVVYGICKPKHKNYNVPYSTVKLDTPLILLFIKALNQIKPDIIYCRHNKHKLQSCVLVAKIKKSIL